MTTIVKLLDNGGRYILLGVGFGQWKSEVPSPIFGSLIPVTDKGSSPMAAIADFKGQIGWVPTSRLRVLSVDDLTPGQALGVEPVEEFDEDDEEYDEDGEEEDLEQDEE